MGNYADLILKELERDKTGSPEVAAGKAGVEIKKHIRKKCRKYVKELFKQIENTPAIFKNDLRLLVGRSEGAKEIVRRLTE